MMYLKNPNPNVLPASDEGAMMYLKNPNPNVLPASDEGAMMYLIQVYTAISTSI